LLERRGAVPISQTRQVFNSATKRGLPTGVQLEELRIVGGEAAVLGEVE
jgi:hypothetical protein